MALPVDGYTQVLCSRAINRVRSSYGSDADNQRIVSEITQNLNQNVLSQIRAVELQSPSHVSQTSNTNPSFAFGERSAYSGHG